MIVRAEVSRGPGEGSSAATDRALEPLALQSTPSIVASRLRAAIMHGALRPGARLGEAKLAAQLGVSRGPLREAMQRLVQEGLLRSERNRGLFVIELEADDVRDVYIARKAIDQAAAALLLAKDTGPSVRRLRGILATMSEAAKRGDRVALTTADLDFHAVFVEEAGSPRLARMARTLLTETQLCVTALERRYDSLTRVVAEHGAVVRALTERDEAKLMAAIQAHMDDALVRLVGPPKKVILQRPPAPPRPRSRAPRRPAPR